MRGKPKMTSSPISYVQTLDSERSVVREGDIEDSLIGKLRDLKYTDRPDIRDLAALEANRSILVASRKWSRK